MDNGSDAQNILTECNQDLRDRFEDCRILIIAKGQGNFETLSDAPGNIFFLFSQMFVIANLVNQPMRMQMLV